jgi:hypothetical protein
MEPDNFNFHIMPDTVRFYHKNLVELINSLEEKDRLKLEEYGIKLSKISKRDIKLTWGGKYYGLPKELNLSNLLTYIDTGFRESLYLTDEGGIKSGYLTYYGHNLNEKSRACVYSILLRYVSILDQKAIKFCKF